MSAVHRDSAETRQTMAIIHAMTKNGPTRWAGNPLIEAKDDSHTIGAGHNYKGDKK